MFLFQLSGQHAASTLQTDFSVAVEQLQSSKPKGYGISEIEERRLIYQVAHPTLANTLGLSTLQWALSARINSPRIRLHYGLSERARSAFSVSFEHSIFATVAATDETKVYVMTNPTELSSVPSSKAPTTTSPSILQSKTGDYVPLTNCDPATKPAIMLYAHAADSDLAKWIRVLAETLKCAGIRFAAPNEPYAPPRSKPSLQAYIAHATLRSTEYKVVDDRVFETLLFPDCPTGVKQSLCQSRELNSSQPDPFIWRSVGAGDDEEFKLTPLQASLFVTNYAKKKNTKDRLGAFLDSLSLYAEDAPGVTRSIVFRDALDNWWSSDDEKSALKAIRRFRGHVGDKSFVMLNGFQLDIDGMRQGVDPLLACLSSTSAAAHHLSAINVDSTASKIPPPRATADSSEKIARVRVLLPVEDEKPPEKNDSEDNESGQSAAVWLNNMHADSRYKKWPQLNFTNSETVSKFVKDVRRQMERKISPGMMHLQLVKIRAHVVTMVLVVDPADLEHLSYLSIPETIVRGDLPIRVALVLVPNSRSSKLIAATFHHLLRVNGRKTAVQFLSMLTQVIQYFGGSLRGASALPESMINLAFQQLSSASEYEAPAQILKFDTKAQRSLNEAHRFAEKLRLYSDIDPNDQYSEEDEYENMDEDKKKPDGEKKASTEKVTKQVSMLCVLNGIVVKDVARDLVKLAVKEQQRVADLMESGTFVEISDVQEMNSDQWISADANLIVVRKLSEDTRSGNNGRSSFSAQTTKDTSVRIPAKDVVAVISDARDVTYIDNGVQSDDYRVTVWLTGFSQSSKEFERARTILQDAAKSEFALQTYTRFAVLGKASSLHNTIMNVASRAVDSLDEEYVKDSAQQSIFVINGRILLGSAVLSEDDLFVEIASEFQTVVPSSNLLGESRLVHKLFEREVSEACTKDNRGIDTLLTQETVLKAISDVNVTSFFESSPNLPDITEYSTVSNEKALNVIAVVDPTDQNAFIITSLLRVLRSAYGSDDMSLALAIVPTKESAKVKFSPPKTFYRFALTSDDLPVDADLRKKGDVVDQRRFSTRVSFDRMPRDMVMTLAVEPPRAWFVSSHITNYDMDNIILNQMNGDNDLFSEYALRNLIVEGSCIDEKEQPPQGLKLILSDGQGVTVDTIVMANLGYFQLKVPNPGMWWLSLARGASSQIFSLRAMEMYKDGARSIFDADDDGRVPIPVQSLSGAGGILLRVAHKPGMEGKSVLESKGKDTDEKGEVDQEESGSKGQPTGNVMNKLKTTFTKLISGQASPSGDAGKPIETEETYGDLVVSNEDAGENETINVFSVASGHLYERFLKIMISSVTKHASRKVKFWLLENYLSPSFKKALPEFAREHGATVGMVTYRWPGWLRAQTEKQRIIWAYKILFLDVLFPLDVNRIIFVDSDQVIRGDLAELMDIDLHGAPYGYVPFCDSRKEVEGYRFWKSGFWKETLKGQKYRISALYVVDLKRFRETAAGDTLRFIYQSLSADPNSLSNLDQDLPNYASVNSVTGSAVPIFNLPQEWLWCESWCDDESKTKAKAIDLCNNPMTKEPKLDSAKRIISEWVDLDNNASTLTEVIYKRLVGQPAVTPHSTSSSKSDGEGEEKTEL